VKTDDLIDLLAHDSPKADGVHWRMRLAMTLLVGFVIALVWIGFSIGFRQDMYGNMLPLLAKTAFSAAAAALALPLAMRLLAPGRPLGWRIAAIGIFVTVCALAAMIALMGEAPQERMHAWFGGGRFPTCLFYIPMFAAPTAIGLLWLARGLAPTRLTITGAAIGALAGGVSAVAYSAHCPIDSVSYVTTWYTLSIGLCAALGAVLGQRLLRW
jgi:hypothetical protein